MLRTAKHLSNASSIFRVRARNTAADSENKIHDDRVAAAYGFRGGLVPGVTVYGYMIPPVLERFGDEWLAGGGMNVRFLAPCYEGETVVSRCQDLTVTAEHEDGSVYASGTVTIGNETDQPADVYPIHPLTEMEQRPAASAATIVPGSPLGSIRQALDVQEAGAIPERLLRMANEILVRNFRMSPWIHVGSQVRHHRLAECGQEITVTGAILECFERKGRRFAVAGIGMSAEGQPVASVRHTFIYGL
jgi:acyl dehydratase